MAAFTTKANGNWSASGATTWTQAGVPGDGDTVTISHNIVVDVDTTIGSDAGSAIAGGSATVKTVTINASVTLTVKGDISCASSTWLNVIVSAGGTLKMYPSSGVRLKLTTPGGWPLQLTCNGSIGSRATVTTDKSRSGLNSWMDITNRPGLLTATCADFVNWGDATHAGVMTHLFSADGACSITNCTFTNCNYLLTNDTTNHNNYTFSNNIFTSSSAFTFAGVAQCAIFNFAAAPTSETRTGALNSFDLSISCTYNLEFILTDNYFGSGFLFAGGSSWAADTGFARNLSSVTLADPSMSVFGSLKDCYFVNQAVGNPHYLTIDNAVTACTVTGLIFESTGTGGVGDCIFPATIGSGTPTMSVKNCIVLPDASDKSSGKLVSYLSTSKVSVTVEHNTYCSTSGESGLVGLDETGSSTAGNIPSCRANLLWAPTGSTNSYAVFEGTGGTPAVDAVTVAGYNGFWHPNTATCYYNTSTSQAGVTGYSGIKISANTAYPSATIGTGDISGDPAFVDQTRDLASWGGTAAGGSLATVAGALATIAANPALIGQATTGLLAWIRAGFRPTNVAFKAVSYPADASTTDAGGNSWPGAGPDIGAMAFATSTSTANDGPPYPIFQDGPSKPTPSGWV